MTSFKPNPAAPIRRILVPIDFSESSHLALVRAAELAFALGAEIDAIHVAHVQPPPGVAFGGSPSADLVMGLAKRELQQRLDRFIASVEGIGKATVRARIEVGEDPALKIVELARHHDMIIMGTHGRTGLAKLRFGSVAEQVVRRAECPVLSVRAQDRERPAPIVVALRDVDAVQRALAALIRSGVSIDDVSVMMTEDTHDKAFSSMFDTQAARAATAGGIVGGTIGGMLGGVLALGTAITGLGLVIVGPAAAFAAAGSLAAGMIGAGVPTDEARRLQEEIHRGKALVAIHPRDAAESSRIERLFSELGVDQVPNKLN